MKTKWVSELLFILLVVGAVTLCAFILWVMLRLPIM